MSTQKNYQEHFLNSVRKDHISVTLFLMNGFQLRGVITGYDNYVVLLEADGKQHMIFKHAISTIVPATALAMTEG